MAQASRDDERKGEATARGNERDFPHIVEIPTSPFGFGDTLKDMVEWHDTKGIKVRNGRSRREQERDFV